MLTTNSAFGDATIQHVGLLVLLPGVAALLLATHATPQQPMDRHIHDVTQGFWKLSNTVTLAAPLTSRTDISAAITMPIDTASPCRYVPYPVAVSIAWPKV
eukprot:GHUV01035396.1.p2 GENE.GHUV01035396.1~~GHUV01035396.1.p2  ORF type:complete len:101 (+),score=6.17 GHUV01035396.1:153-455(+)